MSSSMFVFGIFATLLGCIGASLILRWFSGRFHVASLHSARTWVMGNKPNATLALLSLPIILLIGPVIYWLLLKAAWFLFGLAFLGDGAPNIRTSAPRATAEAVRLDEDAVYAWFAEVALDGGDWKPMPLSRDTAVRAKGKEVYSSINLHEMEGLEIEWPDAPDRGHFRMHFVDSDGGGQTRIAHKKDAWGLLGTEGKVFLVYSGDHGPTVTNVLVKTKLPKDGAVRIRTEGVFPPDNDATWGPLMLVLEDGREIQWTLRVECSKKDGASFPADVLAIGGASIRIGRDAKDEHAWVSSTRTLNSDRVIDPGNLVIHTPDVGEDVLLQVMLTIRPK